MEAERNAKRRTDLREEGDAGLVEEQRGSFGCLGRQRVAKGQEPQMHNHTLVELTVEGGLFPNALVYAKPTDKG